MEELNSVPNEADKQSLSIDKRGCIKNKLNQELIASSSKDEIEEILNATFVIETEADAKGTECCSVQRNVEDFLLNERKHSDIQCENIEEQSSDISHNQISTIPNNLDESLEKIESVHSVSQLGHNESMLADQEVQLEEKSLSENFNKNNYNEYSQFVDMENAKNSLEYDACKNDIDYINIIDSKNPNSGEDNIFDMLADIRFSGPTDSQLMSTSFSESNTCDEKEWDSGSDSRSSSSGEFIWKVSSKKLLDKINTS